MTAPATPDVPSAPDRVERPWGWYESVFSTDGHQIKRIGVHPGRQISLQLHHRRAEHWVVVRGEAWVTLGERAFALAVGGHVDIPVGAVHRLANRTDGPLEIVEVQFGDYLGEDDIVRLQDDFGRA